MEQSLSSPCASWKPSTTTSEPYARATSSNRSPPVPEQARTSGFAATSRKRASRTPSRLHSSEPRNSPPSRPGMGRLDTRHHRLIDQLGLRHHRRPTSVPPRHPRPRRTPPLPEPPTGLSNAGSGYASNAPGPGRTSWRQRSRGSRCCPSRPVELRSRHDKRRSHRLNSTPEHHHAHDRNNPRSRWPTSSSSSGRAA